MNLNDVYARCNFLHSRMRKFWRSIWRRRLEKSYGRWNSSNWEEWHLEAHCESSKEKKVIGVKWIYKVKLNLNGSIQRKKVRLVAKIYSQEQIIDYN